MPLTICSNLLQENITGNCENPIFTGVEEIGYIFNKADILSWVSDSTNEHLKKNFALRTDAYGYKIYNPTKQPFNGIKTTMTEGAVSNKFDNVVPFIIPNDGPDVEKNVIEKLANGEFVVVIVNKWANIPNNKFQIYGYHKGLRASSMENDKYSEDTDGGWSVELTESGAPKSGMYLFDTDIQTTRSFLEGLCQ